MVRSFKTSLDRQVAEAIRIYRRGLVLNKKGEYNRCGLTRMVLDDRWEQEKWERSWEEQDKMQEGEEIDNLTESKKNKNNIQDNGAKRKRRKIENEEGVVWGEPVGEGVIMREEFLKSGREATSGQLQQQKIKVLTGVEWMAHKLVMEIVGLATQVVLDTCLMAEWDEWSEVESHPPLTTPTDIVGHGHEAGGLQEYPLPPENNETKVKNVTKKNKNKKRGKAALVKVDPGQRTMDAFVVKMKKNFKKCSVNPIEEEHSDIV